MGALSASANASKTTFKARTVQMERNFVTSELCPKSHMASAKPSIKSRPQVYNYSETPKFQTAVPRLTFTLLVAQGRERVRRRTSTFPEKAWGGAMPSFKFFRSNGGPEMVHIFRTKCPDFPDNCPDFPDIFHILWKFSKLHTTA